ncbi:MAG: cysteine desulfurase [Microthrixaceae bacterium]|nr:cysteine desulfurase [Microthrixaceae bacterium]MCO5313514.1 cysteine desulfurase [Microthrixaceae bacterium]
MARTYLDYASTTPLRPEAGTAMIALLEASGNGEIGDPSRSHSEGLDARRLVEDCRDVVAAALGARSREVVFCSGATEAIAAASHGAVRADPTRPHSVLSAVEHAAVRTCAERGPHTSVGADRYGRVSPDELLDAVRSDTAVVHLQWANHEVGTIQPVAEVAARVAELDDVLFHVDAAQAAGRTAISFKRSGADLLSVSGHKLGGPTGVGALLVRRGVRLDPLITGGDQERARRAGIENVVAIAGFAAALNAATATLAAETERLETLRSRIVDWARDAAGVGVLGHPDERLAQLVCLEIDGIEPQPILIGLDRVGIAVHSGNSCSSEALEPSPVLAAMGADAQHSLRISMGHLTTDEDIDRLLAELPRVLEQLWALRR